MPTGGTFQAFGDIRPIQAIECREAEAVYFHDHLGGQGAPATIYRPTRNFQAFISP
jgi:hypothetical protein